MRKPLTALALAATAFAAPMLASGTAYAAEITPVVPSLPAVGQTISVDASTVTDIVARAIGGGCTTTYEGQVAGQPIGGIVTISGLIVTINGYNAEGYAFAQEGHTVAYVWCMV
jgi:hypothetical protein